jgi:hypothetical protein
MRERIKATRISLGDSEETVQLLHSTTTVTMKAETKNGNNEGLKGNTSHETEKRRDFHVFLREKPS